MHTNNEEPNLQPAPKKPEMFNLAKMFHAYLKLMNIDVALLKPFKIKRIKLAFYGGISCHIVMLGQSLQGTEEDATVILKNIDDQLNEYWKSENIDFNLNYMKTHELKTGPSFFDDVLSGNKNFEVRKYDRDFKVGDILLLNKWDNTTNEYMGRQTSCSITYILEGGQFGIEKGYCVLGLKPIRPQIFK